LIYIIRKNLLFSTLDQKSAIFEVNGIIAKLWDFMAQFKNYLCLKYYPSHVIDITYTDCAYLPTLLEKFAP